MRLGQPAIAPPLALALAVLTLILLIELVYPLTPAPGDTGAIEAPATSAGTPATIATLSPELLAPLFTRPPFSQDRRAARGPARTESGPVRPSSLPRLAGIIVTANSKRALFQTAAGEKPTVVEVGELIDGYRVDAIDRDGVALSGPDGSQTLRPSFDPNAEPPPPQMPVPISHQPRGIQPPQIQPNGRPQPNFGQPGIPQPGTTFDPRRMLRPTSNQPQFQQVPTTLPTRQVGDPQTPGRPD